MPSPDLFTTATLHPNWLRKAQSQIDYPFQLKLASGRKVAIENWAQLHQLVNKACKYYQKHGKTAPWLVN